MILVTGAGGKTGKAIVQRLVSSGNQVRAWVHHPEEIPSLRQLGAADVVSGDIMQVELVHSALNQVDSIYHICSNMNPLEVEIGQNLLTEASQCGVRLFGFHSVLHPHIQQMPHHWNKLLVEEAIFRSGLRYVILQPTAYMQNLLAYWARICKDGIFSLPYAPQTRLSMVDLEDVAEAASKVLTDPAYVGGIYELVGTPAMSQLEVAQLMGQKLGKKIDVQTIPLTEWEEKARMNGMDDYSVMTLAKMFTYYEAFGFGGSQKVLEAILKRPATGLDQFLDRILVGTSI